MRLLVTRPIHDFAALAARLEAKGHEAVSAPMLDIAPLAFDVPDPENCDGLVFSSANAVRVLAGKPGLEKWTGLGTIAVGAATADAARTAGFSNVTSAAGTINDVANMLRKAYSGRDLGFIHFAGVDRAGDLASLIGKPGPDIETIEVYSANPVRSFPARVGTELRNGEIDGCILLSPRSAAIYASLAAEAGLIESVQDMVHFCLSPNVAQQLEPLGLVGRQIKTSPGQNLDSLLLLL